MYRYKLLFYAWVCWLCLTLLLNFVGYMSKYDRAAQGDQGVMNKKHKAL